MAEYCLRWNNHQPNLVTVFSELLTAESLVDVTLATDGHFIHAHKLVLSACSVYFKDLFRSNPCKHPIVFLKDIRIEDLKTVIDFIYRGEVNVSQDRLQDVLKTAESLRIKGLADKPFSYDEYPSQRSGQHHSSSFSSQRSSLTDSRDQVPSVDADDIPDIAGNSPPAAKKRKVTATSQDSSESIHDANHEVEKQHKSDSKDDTQKKSNSVSMNEEGTLESTSFPIKEKVKEENDSSAKQTDSQPEFKESGAADAMLLLQRSSSEAGGDEGSTITNPTSNTRGDLPASLISSHSQGHRGRPPHHRTNSHSHHSNSFPRKQEKEMNLSQQERGSYLLSTLPVRPKLKASNGSYVTIRTGTAENFLKAVEDVRNGKMGFCKAGKIYGVNHATLLKFYKAMGYHVLNKSNNPNYLKSDSEHEEKPCDSSDSFSHQKDENTYHPSPYTPTQPMYQHFMMPYIEHSTLTCTTSTATISTITTPATCESSQSKDLMRMIASTASSHLSTNEASHQKNSSPVSTHFTTDSMSKKLEFTNNRLLNYASLCCEAIGVSDNAEKESLTPPVALPFSSSHSQENSSLDPANQQSLDVNHSVVLCNL